MPRLHPVPRRRPNAAGDPQSGVALVMALIFSILLYILVADLVVSSRMVRATGENDALLAYMEVSVDPRRADDKDFLVQTVVDHRQALRSASAELAKERERLVGELQGPVAPVPHAPRGAGCTGLRHNVVSVQGS